MLIKCEGKLIDEGKARDYTPISLPPIGSIIKIHPFVEAGEIADIEVYKVLKYEFNIHKSSNKTYIRDEPIMHVERIVRWGFQK
jgi:hypothetical protein